MGSIYANNWMSRDSWNKRVQNEATAIEFMRAFNDAVDAELRRRREARLPKE